MYPTEIPVEYVTVLTMNHLIPITIVTIIFIIVDIYVIRWALKKRAAQNDKSGQAQDSIHETDEAAKSPPTFGDGVIILPITYAPGDIRTIEFRDCEGNVKKSPQERVKNAFTKGRAELTAGQYEQAREWFQKGLDLETDACNQAIFHLNLGIIELVIGDRNRADDIFETSEELAIQAKHDDCIQAAQQNRVVLIGI